MIRTRSVQPDELADELVSLIEAGARLGLAPDGQAPLEDVQDVLARVRRRLIVRLGSERSAAVEAPFARLGGRVSER